jgi:hypothetical protein
MYNSITSHHFHTLLKNTGWAGWQTRTLRHLEQCSHCSELSYAQCSKVSEYNTKPQSGGPWRSTWECQLLQRSLWLIMYSLGCPSRGILADGLKIHWILLNWIASVVSHQCGLSPVLLTMSKDVIGCLPLNFAVQVMPWLSGTSCICHSPAEHATSNGY